MLILVFTFCLITALTEIALITNPLAQAAMFVFTLFVGVGSFLVNRDTCVNELGDCAFARWRNSTGLTCCISLSVIADVLILLIAAMVVRSSAVRWEGVIASTLAVPLVVLLCGYAGAREANEVFQTH